MDRSVLWKRRVFNLFQVLFLIKNVLRVTSSREVSDKIVTKYNTSGLSIKNEITGE